MPPIVGIQFQPKGKQYHFDTQGITDLLPGDRVVVETARGRQLGIVSGYVPKEKLDGRACKPITRRATPRDLVMQQQWQAKELPALITCQEQAAKLGLKGYKFFKAEYNFDGSKITILYTTEKKGNLTPLQRELRRILRTKVELYQVGPRDFAKLLDGLGACGEQRCCSRFLTKFNSVSIRMAKLQNISLAPSEITGLCGRLRCCLAYEHEQYAEAAKGLPKRGKEVITPYGKGRVVEVRTLAGTFVIDVGGTRNVVLREDIGKTEFTTPPITEEKWPDWFPSEPADDDSAKPVEKPPSRSADSRKRRSRSSRRRRPQSKQSQADSRKPAKTESRQTAKPDAPQSQSKTSSGRRKSSRRRGRRRPNRRSNQDKQQ
jgi:cell fate regulator YaaT (PSP1 superfamily)